MSCLCKYDIFGAMDYGPLEFVLRFLEEGGASKGEQLLARKRGKELIKRHGPKNSGVERYVLDTLKTEYGITTPFLDLDQEIAKRAALCRLRDIEDPERRSKAMVGWLRGKER